MRNPVIPKIDNLGKSGITERIQPAEYTFQNGFRIFMLISYDRIFHPFYILENKPIRLQFLKNFDSR